MRGVCVHRTARGAMDSPPVPPGLVPRGDASATVAMEKAGFIDLRVESWNYGSGFPKSMNISKTLARYEEAQGEDPFWLEPEPETVKGSVRFEGWGTALKPSWEPVVVGKKPA